MKFTFGFLIYAFVTSCTSAWVLPGSKDLHKAASAAWVAAAISSAPFAAQAVDVTGSYLDPDQPYCGRVITSKGRNALSVSVTDGNPGCPPDGSGKKWTLMGKVRGSNLVVDFTPKGGPRNVKGIYNENGRSIKWDDGNIWTKDL